MTPPDDLVRLRHLRDAAEKAIAFSAGKTRGSLDDDELLRLALTKLVENDRDSWGMYVATAIDTYFGNPRA